MKIKGIGRPLISISLPSRVLALALAQALVLVGFNLEVWAQEAPPLAPSRLSRTQSAASSYNGSVLNGSVVNNSTIGGASRLLRPTSAPQIGNPAPSAGLTNFAAPATNTGVDSGVSSSSLFSAAEQAAFSQVRAPQVSPQVISAPSSNNSSSGISSNSGTSSSQAASNPKFDIGQALRMGAQFVNAVNSGSNNRVNSPPNTARFSSSASALSNSTPGSMSSSLLKNALSKPAFVSKFARPLTASELAVLSKYDVVIVLDKSGSMDERDCPGGMSRWDWCRDQMMSLTAQIGSVFKNGITVALYSSDFEIFKNVNLDYVTRIFGENGPSGGTYTGKVMDAVFDDYFARKASNPGTRKLLVQVVTDGDPSDKGALIAAISRASQMINSPGEITVNFLQIGHEEAGARTLAKLDSDMASEGARFDIVRVEPFAVVEHEGLPRALADAIN
jgi:hypothetical protein